jgi:hypothetical protein
MKRKRKAEGEKGGRKVADSYAVTASESPAWGIAAYNKTGFKLVVQQKNT